VEQRQRIRKRGGRRRRGGGYEGREAGRGQEVVGGPRHQSLRLDLGGVFERRGLYLRFLSFFLFCSLFICLFISIFIRSLLISLFIVFIYLFMYLDIYLFNLFIYL
jgi:hypothetical protein